MSSILSIRSNVSALQVERRLGQSGAALNRSYQSLSSGLRINRASDDAAGLAISEQLKADQRIFEQGVRNFNDGVSLLNIAEGALEELSSIVTRVKELASQAANGVLSDKQRQALDREAQQLRSEYGRIALNAEFNGQRILVGGPDNYRLQGGTGSNAAIFANVGGAVGSGSFGSQSSFTASGFEYFDTVTGDFNLDGLADFAATGDSGTVDIYLGNGNGTFKTSISYGVGGSYYSMALADFNGDGIVDIVTAGTTEIRVLKGNGNGTFTQIASMNSMLSARSVEVGDVDGDNVIDIIASGSSGGISRAQVFKGAGNGSFSALLSYSFGGTGVAASALVDLNNDGKLDLVSESQNGLLSLRLGNGNGTFASLSNLSSSLSQSSELEVADMTGDGIPDLVVSGFTGGPFAIEVHRGTGTGTFAAAVSLSGLIDSAYGLGIGDLNGDGNMDIALQLSSNAMTLLGNGNGTFRAGDIFNIDAFGQGGGDLSLDDFDQDGVLDAVLAGYAPSMSSGITIAGSTATTRGTSPLLPFSLATQWGAREAIPKLTTALNRVAAQKGTIGAYGSRLDAAGRVLKISKEEYANAESQIRDVDVAEETARLARSRIVQQAGVSVLAQANQIPELALVLLRNPGR